MQKFGVFDQGGRALAFYSAELHGDAIPAEAVPLTGEQWQQLVDDQGGKRFVGGAVVDHVKTAAEVAAEQAAAAMAELDEIDRKSIRALREYVAAQPDAPQILKDREAAAQAARGRLV